MLYIDQSVYTEGKCEFLCMDKWNGAFSCEGRFPCREKIAQKTFLSLIRWKVGRRMGKPVRAAMVPWQEI